MSAAESERVGRLALQARAREVDVLLVTAPANVRYLTGFTGTSGLAIVAAGAGRQAEHLFVTDFRYETQAAAEVSLRTAISTGNLLEAACEQIAEAGAERVGFDDRHLSVASHAKLAETLGEGAETVACGGLVEQLREVKDAEEQRRIEAAQRLAERALAEVLEEGGLAGRSERAVAIALEMRMRTLGAEAASFPTIVASGAHAALPHAQPREAEIQEGTLVTVDWGATVDGYCSDCTRTYAAGEPSARAREVYALVLAAQEAALAGLRAGRSGREVDALAREVIERAGEGERFGHGLGHGVGLEVHEGPRLSKTAGEEPLREGTVVTIEPGVYLPGELGVRIEDLVVVSAGGCRNLVALPKQLMVVG